MALDFRFQGGWYALDDWSLVQVTGADRRRFFQGQTTQDLSLLCDDRAVLTARLDRTGRLRSYFYYGQKTDQEDFLLIPAVLKTSALEDFNKYIIMDDVELSEEIQIPVVLFGELALQQAGVWIDFYGEEGLLCLTPPTNLNDEQRVSKDEIELLRLLNGWPAWGDEISEKNLINDCRLNELAISYKKGCFLGQETVAKIENNRGAAYYPVLIELDKQNAPENRDELFYEGKRIGRVLHQFSFEQRSFLSVALARDYRVDGLKLPGVGQVHYFPLLKEGSREKKSQGLFERGATLFQEGDESRAVELLKKAILFDPQNHEAYEALGVIYGRQERYEEAIELMNQLEALDPSSVMAHTNKSLYFMKLGKIEEAEEEKSRATLKSFESFGKKAQEKAQKEQARAQQEAAMLERQKMFEQVLEIDPEDLIANYGLADIDFYYQRYESAQKRLEELLAHETSYSKGYLLLGKCYEALGQESRAREVYQQGIGFATKKGELMPANEMQARLSRLG